MTNVVNYKLIRKKNPIISSTMEGNKDYRDIHVDLKFVDHYGTPSRRHSTSPTSFYSEGILDGHLVNILIIKLWKHDDILKACSSDNLLLLPSFYQKQKRKSVMFPIQDRTSRKDGSQSVFSGTLHFSTSLISVCDTRLAEDKMMNKMTGDKMNIDEYHVYCLINPECRKRQPSLKKLAEIFLSQLSLKVT